MDYPEIFRPLDVRGVRLPNRVVAPPMYQVRPITSPGGIAWYRRLAAGGAGMVIVEGTSVRRLATRRGPEDLEPLVEAIRGEGAVPAIQLFPVVADEGEIAGPDTYAPEQIETLIDYFVRAADCCRKAGFAAVEPHGAHGFPLNQFFMPEQNHRTDAYGGSVEGRGRLAERIIAGVREGCADDLLVLYRHTPVGPGYSIEDSFALVERLVAAGLDVLDVSPAREQVVADLAAEFRRRFDVPVIAVGNMEKPELACEALTEGRCDLVAVGRQLIADAAWPKKVREGKLHEITWCTKCDEACFGHIHEGAPAACVLWDEGELERFAEASHA